MIPALLTCVFVYWLYQDLNAPDSLDVAADVTGADEGTAALAARLDALEARLQALADTPASGRTGS